MSSINQRTLGGIPFIMQTHQNSDDRLQNDINIRVAPRRNVVRIDHATDEDLASFVRPIETEPHGKLLIPQFLLIKISVELTADINQSSIHVLTNTSMSSRIEAIDPWLEVIKTRCDLFSVGAD